MNTPVRPTKTLADYLVIAVSPALIMVMVHSVCFFLVEVRNGLLARSESFPNEDV